MKSEVKATVEFKVNIELTENEARAWDAIVGYGWGPFIKVFKEHLGTHYIKNYEKSAENMFIHTRSSIGSQLHNIDAAKKTINNLNVIQNVAP